MLNHCFDCKTRNLIDIKNRTALERAQVFRNAETTHRSASRTMEELKKLEDKFARCIGCVLDDPYEVDDGRQWQD